MNALILVDIQNDFLPGGSLAVKDGDQVIPIVNKLSRSDAFELVVATQDWHPADHLSFASNHESKKPMETINLDGLDQILWPDHCVQGSEGADFSPKLDLNRVEAIFRKGMESRIDTYSGFYDNGHKKKTGLTGYLRDRGVKEVYIVGLAADVCVKFTVMDALKEDFTTYLFKDATRAVNAQEGDFEKALEEMQHQGAKIIESDEILIE